MEPTPETDVEREKLRLDQERLALEKESRRQENRFLRRNSSVIIASFVPLIIATVSVVQMLTSNANDRRERLINYVKFINDEFGQLRASGDATLHRQMAHITSTVLDDRDDCCTALSYIANTLAKNRDVRRTYDDEAREKHCEDTDKARRAQASMVRSAHAGGDQRPGGIHAIYIYRAKNTAAELTDEVKQKLNDLGYNVPGENEADTPIEQNEIRYFAKSDKAAAEKVQSQLNKGTGKNFVVADYSSRSPDRPGFLEIYVAGSP